MFRRQRRSTVSLSVGEAASFPLQSVYSPGSWQLPLQKTCVYRAGSWQLPLQKTCRL